MFFYPPFLLFSSCTDPCRRPRSGVPHTMLKALSSHLSEQCSRRGLLARPCRHQNATFSDAPQVLMVTANLAGAMTSFSFPVEHRPRVDCGSTGATERVRRVNHLVVSVGGVHQEHGQLSRPANFRGVISCSPPRKSSEEHK